MTAEPVGCSESATPANPALPVGGPKFLNDPGAAMRERVRSLLQEDPKPVNRSQLDPSVQGD